MKTGLVIFFLTLAFSSGLKDDGSRLVKRIDHITIYYNSVEEVDSMMNLFTKVFGLPLWLKPGIHNVITPARQRFYNSGVFLGNVFLEFITYNTKRQSKDQYIISPLSLHAFAFTNEILNTDEELDKRSIKRSDLMHFSFRNKDQSIDTLFTNIVVNDLSSDNMLIFFCKYHSAIFDHSDFDQGDLPVINSGEEQHPFYSNKLRSQKGGPLSIQRVDRITLITSDFNNYRQKFDKVFLPLKEKSEGEWRPNSGPDLLLLQGDSILSLKSIEVKVGSLAKAKEFLTLNHLGFAQNSKTIRLDISKDLGLDLILK
jgi:hypothetical protein